MEKEEIKKAPQANGASTTPPLVTPPSSTEKKRKSEDHLSTEPLNNKRSVDPRRQLEFASLSSYPPLNDEISEVFDAEQIVGTEIRSSQSSCSLELSESELPTQPETYTQDSTAGLSDTPDPQIAWLEDVHCKDKCIPIRSSCVTIGRSKECDIVVENNSVSRNHCELSIIEMEDGAFACTLVLVSKKASCWIRVNKGYESKWEKITKAEQNDQREQVSLVHSQHFRLLPPGAGVDANREGTEYILNVAASGPSVRPNPGTNSFDVGYMRLLRSIQECGQWKEGNKKGPNKSLPRSYTLDIDLTDSSGNDRNLLPLTSLRSLYGGRAALIEALWYLRGEDHIRFLQENRVHFWDKQVKEGTEDWIGLNYGLLTNFPDGSGRPPKNQLEENVVQKLESKGKSSRNMTCSLQKPGEETIQGACTSSVQFSVSESDVFPGQECLNLSVHQRSSDVMVGLPHDVVVWSIILHLVRREADFRYERKLLPGTLSFLMGINSAHVYKINEEQFQEILDRKPKSDCQPYLKVNATTDKHIFDLAMDYDPDDFFICEYTKFHPPIKLEQAVEGDSKRKAAY